MVDLSGAGARQPQLPTRLTLEPAQIITGERVQGMAEVTVISRRTTNSTAASHIMRVRCSGSKRAWPSSESGN